MKRAGDKSLLVKLMNINTHAKMNEFREQSVKLIFGDKPSMTKAEIKQKYNITEFKNFEEYKTFYSSRSRLAFMATLIGHLGIGVELPRKEVAQVIRDRHPSLPVPEELIKYLCDGYLQKKRQKTKKAIIFKRLFGDIETFDKHVMIVLEAESLKKKGMPANIAYEKLSKKYHFTPESIANIVSKKNKEANEIPLE